MKTMIQFLNEHYNNIFDKSEKLKYVDEVWDILQKAYERVGGFKTFATKDEMIEDSFMWKLNIKDNLIISIIIYKKDPNGFRKSIASAFNRNLIIGKDIFVNDLKYDINRCFKEVSGKPAEILSSPEFDQFKIKISDLPNTIKNKIIQEYDINDIHNKDEFTDINKTLNDDYHYVRRLADNLYIKICYGTFISTW